MLDERRQFACNTTAGDRGVRNCCQAFAREIIDDVEHAEPAPAGELVMHEIQGPAGIGLCFDQEERSGAGHAKRLGAFKLLKPAISPEFVCRETTDANDVPIVLICLTQHIGPIDELDY